MLYYFGKKCLIILFIDVVLKFKCKKVTSLNTKGKIHFLSDVTVVVMLFHRLKCLFEFTCIYIVLCIFVYQTGHLNKDVSIYVSICIYHGAQVRRGGFRTSKRGGIIEIILKYN